MKPGSVAIGFLHPGEWSACFGLSLIDLYLVDAHGPQRLIPNGVQLPYLCPSGGIPEARNELVKSFLGSECEWLFMVDSDMGFAPTTVEQLIADADPETAPVVGGLCFGLKKEGASPFYGTVFDIFPTIYDWYEDTERAGFVARTNYERDELVQCSATGAACLLMHRTVLKRMADQHGPAWFDRIDYPVGPTRFSEDLSFCVRLAALNVPLLVDTGVRTTHHKGGIYLDETSFDRQLRAVAAEAELFFTAMSRLAVAVSARVPVAA